MNSGFNIPHVYKIPIKNMLPFSSYIKVKTSRADLFFFSLSFRPQSAVLFRPLPSYDLTSI